MNCVQVLGRLGRDPERKELPGGKLLAKFSVAVREGGDRTTWFDVVAFDKTAEAALRLKKGEMTAVEGRMQKEEYEGKDGVKKVHWSIVAYRIHYTGSAPRGEAAADGAPPF